MKTTFLVRHQAGGEPAYIEYCDREGAEQTAEFLIKTHGGAATVFALQELGTFWRGQDLRQPPEGETPGDVA